MKREFTKLMAALALLLFIAPLGMWGQTKANITDHMTASNLAATGTSYTDFSNVSLTSDAIYAGKSAKNGNNIQLRSSGSDCGIVSTTSGGKIKSVKITVASGTNTINVYGNNSPYTSASDLYATSGNSNQGTKLGSLTSTGTITVSDDYAYVGVRSNSGAVYISDIEFTWDNTGAPTPTTPCDIALTGAPVSLSFDLFNNTTEQVIHYTTSSTGTVYVESNDYVNATVDQDAKTITVTPKTIITGSAQTITVRQNADLTYLAGSVQFTVNITDSTPEPTYIFNTSEGLDALGLAVPAIGEETILEVGHDYISDDVVMTITHGTTNTRIWGGTNSTDLRVYGGGGSLTFSVPSGYQITRIVLTGSKVNNVFSDVSNGVWSGEPNRTVTLTATNTSNINTILVVYEPNTSGVDIPVLPASCNYQTEKEITITGITEGATVYYTTDNTDPKTSSTRIEYIGSFTINATTTVKAVAYLNSNYSGVATATYTRVYNITLNQATGGTISATPVQAAAGETITLTATPNVGYSLGQWNITPATTTVSNNTFTMPASDVTVSASFTTTTAYTISFSVNNKIEMTATVNGGTSIDLTKFVAEGDGYTFEGWSTTDGGENITPQNAYTPTADITLYPGVAPAPSGDEYTLVTNVSDLHEGDFVVITPQGSNNTAMSKEQRSNNRNATVEAENHISKSPTSGTNAYSELSINSNYNDVCELVLGKVVDGQNTYWTFYDPDYLDSDNNVGGYLYSAGANSNNYLRTQHTNSAYGEWTITISNKVSTIYSRGGNTRNYLKYNTSSKLFSSYAQNSDGTQLIYLYKKSTNSAKVNRDGVPTTSKVTGIAANVLVTVKANGIVYLTGSNAGNAANLVVEEGGQLVTSDNVAGTMLKHINGYNAEKDNYYLISHPLASNANPENVLNMLSNEYDLYYFQQNAVDQVEGEDVLLEWRNYHNNPFNMFIGSGYLYANSEDVDIEFAGQLRKNVNDATYQKSITYVGNFRFSGWNLVGNPFPSNASVSLPFYKMNSNGEGINGKPVSANSVIAPMEGVFVVTEANAQVTFTATTDAVTTVANRSVMIDVNRDSEFLDRAIIEFNNGSALRKLNLTENATKVYFQQGQEEFAIVAAENEGELPVNFKASRNGRYTMSFDVENLDMNYLHLIDNKTGNDVDLLATPSYTFQANSSDYESRFRLVFDANTVNENNTTTTFAYFNGTEWVINTPSTGSGGNATLQVIDMMGRVLSSQTLSGNANVNINQPAGIYMLRLVNGENVMVQKVVVR